jgi:hypothetical protein
MDQVAEDAERWPALVGRGTDDGDPPGRLERSFDPDLVEDGDRATALLEVQECGCALPLVRRQWRASLS